MKTDIVSIGPRHHWVWLVELLLAFHVLEDVGVLNVVGNRVDERVVPGLHVLGVELVLDVWACLRPEPWTCHFRLIERTWLVEVILVLLHLYQPTLPLELGQLLRRISDLLIDLLLLDFDFFVNRIFLVLLIDLVCQQFSITLFHFLVAPLLLL